MRLMRLTFVLMIACGAFAYAAAQAPASSAAQATVGQRGVPPQPPGGQPPPGGRGRGRAAVQVMTFSSPAWPDGGQIPAKYTQAGGEVSPPLAWSNVPQGVQTFVLIAHDVDAPIGPGTDDLLHWMLWNIPGTTTSLSEGVAQGPELADGTRQISATGPFYRGPGAAAAGPAHHYVFELFALDASVDVPAVGASPPETRAAVLGAMAGHVRGKASCTGLFKR
jgi:Raf kinase inhibitor-like YbhB/YbcL family protein